MASKKVMVKCGPARVVLRRDTDGWTQLLAKKKKKRGLSKGRTLYSHSPVFSFIILWDSGAGLHNQLSFKKNTHLEKKTHLAL